MNAQRGAHFVCRPPLLQEAEGDLVQIDALEQQINDALVRLSLTGEQVAVHLVGEGQGAGGRAGAEDGAARAALRVSLDYRALFGSPSPAELMSGSSLGGFNPVGSFGAVEDDGGVGDDGVKESGPPGAATLEW